ncbi:uncharacterized protein LOC122306360 [Carya illinoinensis]|uniref:uncharacterized protein LOC122306360 n=1 Tax=Carya illinoinensis TaxID=32201 RepID=UPI001C718BC9|nr:uncharacterized protein LOC122306360 [Carya illinoinensis]
MLWACVLDFKESWIKYLPLVEFAYNNIHQESINAAPYEVLYGRKCRSPPYWDEVGEKKMLGLDLVQNMQEKVAIIRKRLALAQERQKKYAEHRKKELHFEVGHKLFLQVAPMRGVMRFGKKGKLTPRYIGPFEILEKIGGVAYRLALPLEFSVMHDVFNVSMLWKYVHDPTHVGLCTSLGSSLCFESLIVMFEPVSGLSINLSKFEIVPVGTVRNILDLANILGCKVASLSMRYLGLPLGGPHKSVSVWDGVIEKSGRSGGLRVRNLKLFNKALLGKWLWRDINERNASWRHIVDVKYGRMWGSWGSALKYVYPNRIARDKGAAVADSYHFSNNMFYWTLEFTRDMQDWEVREISDFFGRLYDMKFDQNKEDSLLWLHAVNS